MSVAIDVGNKMSKLVREAARLAAGSFTSTALLQQPPNGPLFTTSAISFACAEAGTHNLTLGGDCGSGKKQRKNGLVTRQSVPTLCTYLGKVLKLTW